MPELERINVIWLLSQSCTGDTISFTSAKHPSVTDLLLGFLPEASGVVLAFHPTLMPTWGREAIDVLRAASAGKLDPFLMVVEGAIPNEDQASKTGGFYCFLGEDEGKLVTLNYWIDKLSRRAAAAVAVGTCACYGGMVSAKPNPTDAKGLLDYLGRGWKSALDLPVICVPGCPAQGEWIAETLGYVVLAARGALPLPALDQHHRPLFIFGVKVHECCPRAGYLASGKLSKKFGEPYCMGLLGCKGTISYCDVPKRGFVDGAGGCPTIGSPCIGCTEPGFPDPPFSPFFAKAPKGVWTREAFKDIKGHLYAGLHRLFARRRI
ncbi:MAG: hydrogenase expression protein HypE [Nitrososphaerales archaeon]